MARRFTGEESVKVVVDMGYQPVDPGGNGGNDGTTTPSEPSVEQYLEISNLRWGSYYLRFDAENVGDSDPGCVVGGCPSCERLGFRRADVRQRAREAELAFYGDAFGFTVDSATQ